MPSPYNFEKVPGSLYEIGISETIEPHTIVNMGSFAVSNNVLISEGYANCIALVGCGPDVSLVGHFQRISQPGEGDNTLFLAAVATLRMVKANMILLAGGRLNNSAKSSSELALADRTFAESQIAELLLNEDPAINFLTGWSLQPTNVIDIVVEHEAKKIVTYGYSW